MIHVPQRKTSVHLQTISTWSVSLLGLTQHVGTGCMSLKPHYCARPTCVLKFAHMFISRKYKKSGLIQAFNNSAAKCASRCKIWVPCVSYIHVDPLNRYFDSDPITLTF